VAEPSGLPPGLYERVVSEALGRRLADLHAGLLVRGTLDPEDADVVLAAYVARSVRRALRSLAGDGAERVARQAALCNEILALVARSAPGAVDDPADRVAGSHDLLLARLEPAVPPAAPRRPGRPQVPLSALRVITTTYVGVTDRRALDALAAPGAQIRVCYETRTTRLHAKAWVLHRRSGFGTAYVGSSNLSRSALVDGLEWNVRLAEAEQPHLVDVCAATFDNYTRPSSPTSPSGTDHDSTGRSPGSGGPDDLPIQITALEVRPWPFQAEILDHLEAERIVHGRWRNLVVSHRHRQDGHRRLDYQHLRAAGRVDRLLFVAHREQILRQSLSTFRHVLRDGSFGEVFVAGERPESWRHVFASVQSLHRLDLASLPPDRFDLVIVDEFHHAEAANYTRLLEHLRRRCSWA
jgi:hypothetical protein